MRRREFISLLGGAVTAWSLSAHAQQMRRIGFLHGLVENDPEALARIKAFRHGLDALGWTEGRNIQVDYRFARGDAALARAHADELVSLAPDLIVGLSTPVTAALMQATRTIPIIFAVVTDPVGQGFVASMARPGGNVTGFTFIDYAMVGKWLEILKEIAPTIRRAASCSTRRPRHTTLAFCVSLDRFQQCWPSNLRQHQCVTRAKSKTLSLPLRTHRGAH